MSCKTKLCLGVHPFKNQVAHKIMHIALQNIAFASEERWKCAYP